MTTEEIVRVLRANIGKTVKTTSQDGDTDLVLVLTVDHEGFVFRLTSVPHDEQKMPYWTRFSDLAEVQSVNSPESSK
jgi:hypothetical protein